MNTETGKVKEYNGHTGKIETNKTTFLLLSKELLTKEELKEGDMVEFIPEKVNNTNIARFIKKKNKNF